MNNSVTCTSTKQESDMRNDITIDGDFEYALRMIRGGYATVPQAAQICGIPVTALQAYVEGAVPPLNPAHARRALLPNSWEHN